MMTLLIGSKIAYSGQRIAYSKKDLSATRYTLHAKKGFTLIEVLLAVSILAIGIVGVLRSYSMSISALKIYRGNIDAVCLLKEKMVEIEQEAVKENGLLPCASGGKFADAPGYRWELEIRPGPAEGLNEVILMVFHEDKPGKFSLVTYVESKE